jgi:hypothetical protein
VVNTHFERAYHLHKDHIRANPSKETYRDAVVGFINIAYGWLSEKRYAQGLVWTERFGMLIEDISSGLMATRPISTISGRDTRSSRP